MVALLKMPASEFLSDAPVTDRRMFERKPSQAVATGRRMDHTLLARQNPRLSLNLRDVSMGGLSAISEQPVQEGELISVSVPSRGLCRGWDAFGRVVRCEPMISGYDVAIEFDSLPAA